MFPDIICPVSTTTCPPSSILARGGVRSPIPLSPWPVRALPFRHASDASVLAAANSAPNGGTLSPQSFSTPVAAAPVLSEPQPPPPAPGGAPSKGGGYRPPPLDTDLLAANLERQGEGGLWGTEGILTTTLIHPQACEKARAACNTISGI